MSTDQLDDMWERLHKLRDGTTEVRVSVDALKNLLMDHQDCLKVIKEQATK